MSKWHQQHQQHSPALSVSKSKWESSSSDGGGGGVSEGRRRKDIGEAAVRFVCLSDLWCKSSEVGNLIGRRYSSALHTVGSISLPATSAELLLIEKLSFTWLLLVPATTLPLPCTLCRKLVAPTRVHCTILSLWRSSCLLMHSTKTHPSQENKLIAGIIHHIVAIMLMRAG